MTSITLHAPELYAAGEIVPSVRGFDGIDSAAMERFHKEGYLSVEEAFSVEEMTAARQGLNDLIAGRIEGFTNIQFEPAVEDRLEELTPVERADAVRKLHYFAEFEPRVRQLAFHPRLVPILEQLLGPAPVMFQDMALLKPPHIGREKPWHQDHAYFDYPAGTPIVGVWIAIDEATAENGCMHLLPGLHRSGPIAHFQRRDWQICDSEILSRRCVAAPLKPGGCLVFDGMMPHGTPHNTSSSRRWAIQFHYAPANVPTQEGVRMEIFGAEGKDASC